MKEYVIAVIGFTAAIVALEYLALLYIASI